MYGFWNAVFWILVYTSPGFISQAHPPPKKWEWVQNLGLNLPTLGATSIHQVSVIILQPIPGQDSTVKTGSSNICTIASQDRGIGSELYLIVDEQSSGVCFGFSRLRDVERESIISSLCHFVSRFFFSFSLSLRVVLNAFCSFCLAQKYSCCCRYMITIFFIEYYYMEANRSVTRVNIFVDYISVFYIKEEKEYNIVG